MDERDQTLAIPDIHAQRAEMTAKEKKAWLERYRNAWGRLGRLPEADAEAAQLRAMLPQWERETKAALEEIQNPEWRRAMRYYYVGRLSWAEVAELTGYSTRYLHKLQKKLMEGVPGDE